MNPVDQMPGNGYTTGAMESKSPEVPYITHPLEAVNETVARELLLTELAQTALLLLRQNDKPIGVFDLLDTVAERHDVMQDDAADAVARLRGRFVEVHENASGDLQFVVTDRNQQR